MSPKALDRSVIASAGMPSAAAALTASSIRIVPSTTENSLCRRRWTNEGAGISFEAMETAKGNTKVQTSGLLQFYFVRRVIGERALAQGTSVAHAKASPTGS